MTDNADAPTDLSVHLLNYEVCVSNDNDVGAIEVCFKQFFLSK